MFRGWAGRLAAIWLFLIPAFASASGAPAEQQLAAAGGKIQVETMAPARDSEDYASLRAKIASYAGAEAYYALRMTPAKASRDFRSLALGNSGALGRLADAGYLSTYYTLPKDCRLGMNARRPSCKRLRDKTYFSFTHKALPFFHADDLRKVNIPGLANARIWIGTIKAYEIRSMKPSTARGCDVDVVARKEMAELNDVGKVILDSQAFDEVLCFARHEGDYRLRYFYRLY